MNRAKAIAFQISFYGIVAVSTVAGAVLGLNAVSAVVEAGNKRAQSADND